jgi:hypothetical protein
MLLAAAATYHPFSLLFSSIFPSSHGVKASKLQDALTHEWPGGAGYQI